MERVVMSRHFAHAPRALCWSRLRLYRVAAGASARRLRYGGEAYTSVESFSTAMPRQPLADARLRRDFSRRDTARAMPFMRISPSISPISYWLYRRRAINTYLPK